MLDATRARSGGSMRIGLDQSRLVAGLLQAKRHKAIAPAHIDKRPARRKSANSFDNAKIAVAKPIRLIFNAQTMPVAFHRVRNR